MHRRSLNLEYVEYCQERFEIGDLVEVGLGANDLPAGWFYGYLHALWPPLLPDFMWQRPNSKFAWTAHPVDALVFTFAVYLHHPNGSELEVYLHGANITSWRKPDGSDILFLQPENEFDGVEPIKCVHLASIHLLAMGWPTASSHPHLLVTCLHSEAATPSNSSCTPVTLLRCRGGIPVVFPQYGRGVLPTNGLLQRMHWSIADTGAC